MPPCDAVDCQRDDRRRLITVTLTEPFSFDELLSQTDRQWAEHTWEAAILYDGRTTWRVTPASEIQQLVDHTHVVGGGRPRGPVGVVIPLRPELLRGGLPLAQLGGPRRDIEILLTEAQVEDWLTRNAPRRGSPGHSSRSEDHVLRAHRIAFHDVVGVQMRRIAF
jgi:hypothetical protein